MVSLADWEVTANQFVAVPCLSRSTGAIHSCTVLSRAANGLLEWAADSADSVEAPFLTPHIRIDGADIPFRIVSWERLERWIPRFRAEAGPVAITATLCAPTGYDASRRGAVYAFELESDTPCTVELSLEGTWSGLYHTIASRRRYECVRTITRGERFDGLALEGTAGATAALAVATFGDPVEYRVAFGDAPLEPVAAGDSTTCGAQLVRFSVGRTVQVASRKRVPVVFYLGVANERDGALATASALRRTGIEILLRDTRLDLARMTRRSRDPQLTAILNRNLLLNYFFSIARAIDDDRLYPVTSRSPLHPMAGTGSERGALLWSLPALTLADPVLAREMILRVYEQYSHRPGEAIRYIDGSVLVPGIALDQWGAYGIALDRYIRETGDETILEEPIIADVLRDVESSVYARLHPEVFLAASDLLPSGRAADYPYVIFSNAMLHAFCKSIERVFANSPDDLKRVQTAAEEFAAAIWRRGTVDIDGLSVLAGSTDLAGGAAVYDDPYGSLQLLPFYGLCSKDEPLWRNTVDFLRSDVYPLWHGNSRFPGLSDRANANAASTPALCADLLGSRCDAALETLRQLPLVDGLVTSEYDPESGMPLGAPHDGPIAGFLAWALVRAVES